MPATEIGIVPANQINSAVWVGAMDGAGRVWNGTQLITYTAAAEQTGALPATQLVTGGARYEVQVPSPLLLSGYQLFWHVQAGGSPVATDTIVFETPFTAGVAIPSPTPTPTPVVTVPGVYRISGQQVRAILDFDPSITNLTPFIAAAEQLVNRVCAPSPGEEAVGSPDYVGNPVGYSSAELATIETWLAAHFVAIRDPLYTSNSLGPASGALLRQGGMNLAQTPYGQQAMLLDVNGGLAWLDKHISQGRRAKVGILSLRSQRYDWAYGYPWRFYALGTG